MAEIIDELERERAPIIPAPAPVVESPTPTYARVGPSSWTAPTTPTWRSAGSEPVVTPQPAADPEPAPEPTTPAVVAEIAEPEPTPVSEPEPGTVPEPGATVAVVEQQAVDVTETPKPQRMPKLARVPGEPRVSGGELDTVIAQILDQEGEGIGRRRITAMLPEPRPSDHAVKTALARVKAAREPALNGAGRATTETGSAEGDPNGG